MLQSKLDQYRAIVRELATDHKVTHGHLKKVLHDVMLDEGKHKPKIRLLMCKSYGGYELSNTYKRWYRNSVNSDHFTEHNRTEHASRMKDFGTWCKTTYPIIAYWVGRYQANKHEILNNVHFQEYKRNTEYTFQKGREEIEFGRAVEILGSDNPSIWTNQAFYDALAMRYLIKYSTEFNVHNTAEAEAEEEKLGLLFASTIFCKLGIEEVPPLIDYQITEYDGLESWV